MTGRSRAAPGPAWAAVLLWLLPLAGCTGPEHGIVVDVRTVAPGSRPAISRPDGLKVAIAPFRVEQPDSVLAGSLAPLVGDRIRLIVKGEDVGQDVAEVFVDDLKRRLGWRTWLDKAGVLPLDGGPDVRMSGLLRKCVASADTGFFGTTVEVEVDLAVDVLNTEGGGRLRIELAGRVSRWIGDFEPGEINELLNEAIRQSVDHFLAETEVSGRRLVSTAAGER